MAGKIVKSYSSISLTFFSIWQPVQSCPSCNNGGQTGMWTYMTCIPGAPGAPGRDGAKGDKGDIGTPRLASHMNWKECAWKKGDSTDSGLIYVSTERHFVTRVK